MLSKLDIVKGALAKKDLTPILKHLRIANGWITSTNGRLTISTPIPEIPELNVIVPADKFITAVKACPSPKFKVTKAGRLSVSGGGFRASLPLMADTVFPTPKMAGSTINAPDLIATIKPLLKFIGNDASRPWACGILLYKNEAYATNNVLIARKPITWDGPPVVIPGFCLDEVIRQRKEILQIKTDGIGITFELSGNIWINSVLLDSKWPNAKQIFDTADFSAIKPVSRDLYVACEKILPFCPDAKFPKIHFTETGISTDKGEHEAEVDMIGMNESIWRAEPLLLLLEEANQGELYADFSQWPKPCPWKMKDGVEGLIIGLRT